MRVLSKRAFREFWVIHHDSRQQLLILYKELKAGGFTTGEDLIRAFGNCRSIGGGRYVFNIKGNQYRVIVKISFELQTVWIRFVGTHNEYDKIDALKV
jgi:mRNA interferase HigB